MATQIYIKVTDDEIYDISELVSDISHSTSLKGQAGKLTFNVQTDPNGIMKFDVGTVVEFYDENTCLFVGKIFTIDVNPKGRRELEYSITAYDSMRYLQNHGWYNLKEGTTVLQAFKEICCTAGFEHYIVAPKNIGDDSPEYRAKSIRLEQHTFADVSYFEMFEYIFEKAMLIAVSWVEEKRLNKGYDYMKNSDMAFYRMSANFVVYDNKGTLTLDLVSNMRTPYVIGNNSLMTGFSINESIDKDTFNNVIITQGKRSADEASQSEEKPTEIPNNETIKKWGKLTTVINVKDNATSEQIKNYANAYLLEKNRPTKELKISAIGQNGINAGNGITIMIFRDGLFAGMFGDKDNYIVIQTYVTTANHSYKNGVHLMELELEFSGTFKQLQEEIKNR